ncbi:hypothetical protein ACO0LC_26130 [Undibacterium sp. JH2W]|uniref:hypothetical protein n=1 Tax=Undibacterium sp. JH2W TaxID=3413037 RepID=UPI003BF1EED6
MKLTHLHGDTVTAMAAACALARQKTGDKARSEESSQLNHGYKDDLNADSSTMHAHHTSFWCSHLHC